MKLLKVFFFIVILMIAGLAVVYFYSGSILKKGITEAGPALLGVPIELESIAADPLRGNVEVDKLVVKNPEKYKSDYAFKVDAFDFDFVPQSAFQEAIHIRELSIEGAVVISDGLMADNHQALLKNIQSKLAGIKSSGNEEPETTEDPDASAGAGKKIILDHFLFKDSELVVVLDGEEITKVAFPTIELSEIGTKGNAVTASEALSQIYSAIASETTKVLSVNEEVIRAIADAKLKKIGINDINDLKDPKKLLEDPDKLNNILNALTSPKE